MMIEKDYKNHRWVITHNGKIHYISFFDSLEEKINLILSITREDKINKILNER